MPEALDYNGEVLTTHHLNPINPTDLIHHTSSSSHMLVSVNVGGRLMTMNLVNNYGDGLKARSAPSNNDDLSTSISIFSTCNTHPGCSA